MSRHAIVGLLLLCLSSTGCLRSAEEPPMLTGIRPDAPAWDGPLEGPEVDYVLVFSSADAAVMGIAERHEVPWGGGYPAFDILTDVTYLEDTGYCFKGPLELVNSESGAISVILEGGECGKDGVFLLPKSSYP